MNTQQQLDALTASIKAEHIRMAESGRGAGVALLQAKSTLDATQFEKFVSDKMQISMEAATFAMQLAEKSGGVTFQDGIRFAKLLMGSEDSEQATHVR